jgi:C4-type Zn-finger protein
MLEKSNTQTKKNNLVECPACDGMGTTEYNVDVDPFMGTELYLGKLVLKSLTCDICFGKGVRKPLK